MLEEQLVIRENLLKTASKVIE